MVFSTPDVGNKFVSLQSVQSSSGTNPAFYLMGAGSLCEFKSAGV